MAMRSIQRAVFAFMLVAAFDVLDAGPEASGGRQPDVLVGLGQGILSMPGGRSKAAVNEVTIRSAELKVLLESCGGETIMACFPHFRTQDTIGTSRSGRRVRLPDWSTVFRIACPQGLSAGAFCAKLRRMSAVHFADPDGGITLDGDPPDDSYYWWQWNMEKIDARGAWDISTGTTKDTIGIIDFAIYANQSNGQNHVDLTETPPKVIATETPTPVPTGDYKHHGTHVAGIASAITNNGLGVAGVDWNARLVSEVLPPPEASTDDSVAKLICDAVSQRQAQVINCSWHLANDPRHPRWSTTTRLRNSGS